MLTEQSGSDSSKLEARVAVLEELFVRLAQAGATESILGNGFERVSARLESVSDRLKNIANQMAPLRALAPQEPKLEKYQVTRVQHLVAALASPDPKSKPNEVAQTGAVTVQQRSAS